MMINRKTTLEERIGIIKYGLSYRRDEKVTAVFFSILIQQVSDKVLKYEVNVEEGFINQRENVKRGINRLEKRAMANQAIGSRSLP